MNQKPYLVGQYEKSMPDTLSLQEKLTLSKRAGFDYMEISIDESDAKLARLDWTQSQRKELQQSIQDTQQPIYSMCLSGHRKYPLGSANPDTVRKSLEIGEKAIIFAAEIGLRVIQLAGYDVYYEQSTAETRERFLLNLQKIVAIAAKYGVPLAFETMETEFMNTAEKAMRFVRSINSPYLGVYPDIGNITNAFAQPGGQERCAEAVAFDLSSAKGHIFAAHLKETVPGKFRDIPYGTGHTDFVKNISQLKRLGVGLFVGEFWYDGVSNAEQYITQARDFLAVQFEKAEAIL